MQKPSKSGSTLECYGIMHSMSNCLLLCHIHVSESPLKNMKTFISVLILVDGTNDGFANSGHELHSIMVSEIPNGFSLKNDS